MMGCNFKTSLILKRSLNPFSAQIHRLKRVYIISLVLSLITVSIWPAKGQIDTVGMKVIITKEDTLKVLAHAILYEEIQENRYAACQRFIRTLTETLKVPNSFNYPFVEFQNISIVYPPDSSFRIFTWQLEVSKGDYRYYGAIQMAQRDLKLIPLIDRSFQMEPMGIKPGPSQEWFGGVYYNLVPFKFQGRQHYLLFGYDSHTFAVRRKFMDVMSIGSDGSVIFTTPSIKIGEAIVGRFSAEFAAEATVRFNYDPEMKMIVLDHLIISEQSGLAGPIPDGTYEAFAFKNGYWEHIPKLDIQAVTTPPKQDQIKN